MNVNRDDDDNSDDDESLFVDPNKPQGFGRRMSAFGAVPLGAVGAVTKAGGQVIKGTTGMAMKGATTTTHLAFRGASGIVNKGAGATFKVASFGVKGTTTVAKTAFKARKHIPIIGRDFGKRRNRKLKKDERMAWDSRITAQYLKIKILIKAVNLPNKHTFSKPDTFCAIWEVPPGYRENLKKIINAFPSKQEKEIGRTHLVKQSNNPSFPDHFPMEYRFEQEQNYVVRVYTEDLQFSTDLKEHTFIGGCIFSLGELMGSKGCTIARPLRTGKSFVVLSGNEVLDTREVFEFRFSGQDLGLLERKSKAQLKIIQQMQKGVNQANIAKHLMDSLEKFDPYFKIEKLNPNDKSWTTIWKSEVIKDNTSPTWSQARLPLQLLCNEDPSNPSKYDHDPQEKNAIKISIWVWNKFTSDELVGFVETSVDNLVKQSTRGIPVFDVLLERKRLLGGVKLKKAGSLKVLKGKVLNVPSVLQYIAGGCTLNLMIAIDCTLLNGDWRDDQSLHFHSEAFLNDYQAAIHRLGVIFDAYECRHKYQMWGYGASIEGVDQPFFSITDDVENADDLIKAYDKNFAPDNSTLELGNVAELKHVVQAGMFRAQRLNSGSKQCYSTLVILSTGAITDLQESIDAVCAAAEDAPLSIVVIGIGDGDFSGVQRLVADETGKLSHSNGVPIARDIVQFVAMDDYNGNARTCVAEALREIPEQFVQHFTNSGEEALPRQDPPKFTIENVYVKKRKKSKKKEKKPGPLY